MSGEYMKKKLIALFVIFAVTGVSFFVTTAIAKPKPKENPSKSSCCTHSDESGEQAAY
jgi:hypothetical protein